MWMRCQYLYLEATRETWLSKMSVTKKNLAGKVSRGLPGSQKGDEAFQDVRHQEEFGGKSVAWVRGGSGKSFQALYHHLRKWGYIHDYKKPETYYLY